MNARLLAVALLCWSTSAFAIQRIPTPEERLASVVREAQWDLHHELIECPRASRTRVTIRANGDAGQRPQVRVSTSPRSSRLEACVAGLVQSRLGNLQLRESAEESVTFPISARMPELSPARTEPELRERLMSLDSILRGCVRPRAGMATIEVRVANDGLTVNARVGRAASSNCLEALVRRVDARGFEAHLEYRLGLQPDRESTIDVARERPRHPTRRRRVFRRRH